MIPANRRRVNPDGGCDEVYLAEMAEALARRISENHQEIRSVRSYSFAAMATRAEQWIRNHPIERHFDTIRALEHAAGASDTDESARAEWGIFFQQILSQLSDRDRQILVLVETHSVSYAFPQTLCLFRVPGN